MHRINALIQFKESNAYNTMHIQLAITSMENLLIFIIIKYVSGWGTKLPEYFPLSPGKVTKQIM